MYLKGWRKIGVIFTALAVAACGSDPVDGGDGDLAQQIYGSWTWLSSEGGFTGGVSTPQTEGYEQRLVFRAPFEAELFVDGESVGRTVFSLPDADADDGGGLVPIVFVTPLRLLAPEFVQIDPSGTLVLVDPCCDMFVHRFTPVG